MKAKLEKTIAVKDEEEMDNCINNIISEKNYSGYGIGPLHTKYESNKVVHGYMVYFYDNDNNVVDVVNFKIKHYD
jgi:hypothetical protein